MKAIKWDYTDLAPYYSGRPPYAGAVISEIVSLASVAGGDRVCDIGAGTGHLTVQLVDHGLEVDAVEPNEAMRNVGRSRTRARPVAWYEARAEATRRPDDEYALVTFGSSFNVVDPGSALEEAARILRPFGWMACLWNHRDLADPLQAEIEGLIRSRIPDYDYGYRRGDAALHDLRSSSLFGEPRPLEHSVRHEVDAGQWIDAWHAHATLARQAGNQWERIVDEIEALVAHAQTGSVLVVPYTTKGWIAQAKGGD